MRLTDYDIRSRFQQHRLRMTPQRTEIYRALVETSNHPTAEQLLLQVRRRVPRMSANTVYYTLGALQRAGLVQEVNYGHERARFDGNLEPHHHVICRSCRSIDDVRDEHLDSLHLEHGLPQGFEMTGHRVEVYGYCAACCRRQASARVRHTHSHSLQPGRRRS